MYNQTSYPVSRILTDQSGNIYISTSGAFASTSLSEKFTILTGGNVGIGTTTPDYKLEVESTSDADLVSIKSTAIANNTQMRLGISGNDSVISGTGGSTGNLVFKTYGSERMRIDSSGRTSIIGVFESASSEGILNLKQSSGVGSLGMGFHDTGSNPHFWLQSRSNSNYATTYNLALQPTGGNVGIGTTSPQSGIKLDVRGNVRIGDGSSSEQDIHFLNSNTEWQVGVNNGGNGTDSNQFYFYEGGNYRLTVQKGGNVGVGTSTPSYKLDVNGTTRATSSYHQNVNFTNTPAFQIGTDAFSSGFFVYDSTAAAYRMVVKSSTGYVGIGTTSPATYLDIAGDSIAIGTGYNFSINANNDGNWGFQVQRTSGVDDYNVRMKFYPAYGSTRKLGFWNSNTSSWMAYFDGSNAAYPDFNINNGNLRLNSGSSLYVDSGTNYNDIGYIYLSNSRSSISSEIVSGTANGDTNLTLTTRYNGSAHTAGTFTHFGYFKAKGRNKTSFTYGSGYTFHNFESHEANEPTLVVHNSINTGEMYGINVIHTLDRNNTTSRFFLGQGGSTERIKIYSNGNIQNSNNSYGQLSDETIKENIVDATPKLDEINQVRVVNFNYIGEEQKQIGVVAQELEQIFPGLVYEAGNTEINEDGKEIPTGETTKAVKYSVFVPILIKAVQELKAEVETLKLQING